MWDTTRDDWTMDGRHGVMTGEIISQPNIFWVLDNNIYENEDDEDDEDDESFNADDTNDSELSYDPDDFPPSDSNSNLSYDPDDFPPSDRDSNKSFDADCL
jgi:hypothetical protein